MTSQAQALAPLPGVAGLAFLAFPLHPAGRPSQERADHLSDVRIPMLFLQGTRDELASLELLEPVVQRLGARATLKLLQEADHSFHVRASSGRRDPDVRQELILALVRLDRRARCVTDNKKKLKIAAAISLSFTGIVVLIMTLLVKGVITFQLALLMLVALLGLYFGFGVLIALYRFVDRLK